MPKELMYKSLVGGVPLLLALVDTYIVYVTLKEIRAWIKRQEEIEHYKEFYSDFITTFEEKR